jgi:hypothetical protein
MPLHVGDIQWSYSVSVEVRGGIRRGGVAVPIASLRDPDLHHQRGDAVQVFPLYAERGDHPFHAASSAWLSHDLVWRLLFFLVVRWDPPCDHAAIRRRFTNSIPSRLGGVSVLTRDHSMWTESGFPC